MANLDPTQPRPSAELSRAIAAGLMRQAPPAEADEMRATFTRPLQDEDPMPTLTDEIKTFIVKGLACYDTPSQVAEAVKAMFGLEVSRKQFYYYDPGCSQPPAQRWRDLHAATRAALLRELSEIGIAHRAVRLRRLDRLASRSERNNVTTALKCLEMAAKECGGMYENRKPIVAQPTLSQPALPQYAMPEPPAPPPAAAQAATPAPRPAPQPPVVEPASIPERPASQAAETQPQATALQPATSLLSMPLPIMPQPDRPASSVPQPLAAPAQSPQPPALPEARPLSRVDRYLTYVRDRHARDRQARDATVAQAGLDSGRISTGPTAS
jgi:hypothetical protein